MLQHLMRALPPKIVRLLLLLGFILAGTGSSARAQNLFQILENAVDGAFGVRQQPAEPKPAAGQTQAYQERLQLYLDARRDWVTRTAGTPAPIADQFKELSQAGLEKEVKRYAGTPINGNGINANGMNGVMVVASRGLGEGFPTLFAMENTPAAAAGRSIEKEVRSKLFSQEQSQQLTQAAEDRVRFRREANRDYLIALLDKDLYLSQEQRQSLTKTWKPVSQLLDTPFVSWQAQNYYMPQEAMQSRLNGEILNVLNPSQKALQSVLSQSGQSNDYLTINMMGGSDSWRQQIDEASIRRREAVLRNIAVRVAYYESELKLPPEQLDRLRLAGKGAAVRITEDWKESMLRTIEMNAPHWRGNGNISFGMESNDTDSLQRNPLWAAAMKSSITGPSTEIERGRKEWHRRATAVAILALLDQELWLLPEQREKLLPLVEKSLPVNSDPTQSQDYIREIILVAHPLLRITDAEQQAILTPSQQAAWTKMKTYFAKPFGSNNVQIAVDGGSFSFSLGN